MQDVVVRFVLVAMATLAVASCAGDGNGVSTRAADADRTDPATTDERTGESAPTTTTATGPTTSVPVPILPTLPPPPNGSVVPTPSLPLPLPPAPPAPVTTAADQPNPPAAVSTLRMGSLTVVDPSSSGLPAFTVLVPQGWNAEGSVQWLPFWSRLAFVQTRVNDPVSGVTVDWLPIQDFMYFTPPTGFEVPIGGNYQGKAYVPPITDPVQFVRDFWMGDSLFHLRDATVVSVTEMPIAAAAFVEAFGGPATAGAYRIRYEYVFEGVVWEQDVSFALLFSGTDIVSWYVNFATTAGGPKGELDRHAGLVSTIVASRLTTPEWEANLRVVQQLFRNGIEQQMADTAEFGRLLAEHRAWSQQLQQQVVAERAASQDRRNEIFRETLGGVQGYVDPVNGGIVQLPLGWDTYWVNQAGEYIVVADPNFDPNTMNDGTWIILEPRL